jgi:hypothetical protein
MASSTTTTVSLGGRLATIPVLGRKYHERFGFVYHPDYRTLWCGKAAG